MKPSFYRQHVRLDFFENTEKRIRHQYSSSVEPRLTQGHKWGQSRPRSKHRYLRKQGKASRLLHPKDLVSSIIVSFTLIYTVSFGERNCFQAWWQTSDWPSILLSPTLALNDLIFKTSL
jgi:hypothetical protein